MNPFSSKNLSLDSLFKTTPNLYGQVSAEVNAAIEQEVKTYNFSGNKQKYITAKIEGSIAASNIFDDKFQKDLSNAQTPSARKEVIRRYLREYIKKEIDIEIANVKSEVRNNLISKNGSLFALLDPRWKGKIVPGDFSKNENYRKNLTSFLFPEAQISETSGQSDYTKYINGIIKDFNNDPDNYFIKNPKDREKLLNLEIEQKFKSVYSTKIFNPDLGEYISLEDQLILSKIDSQIGNSFKNNLTNKQKLELLEAIKQGNINAADKYLNKSKVKNPNELFSQLKQIKPVVSIDANGVAIVKVEDNLKNFFDKSLDKYKNKVQKNPVGAVLEFQQNYTISSISSLKSIISNQGKNADPQILDTLKKAEISADFFNLANALRSKNLSTNGVTQVSALKQNLLNAVNTGNFTFGSESEKNKIIAAINSGNYKVISKFVTPGVLGKDTFGKFLDGVNDSVLDIAGKFESQELAAKSINFGNHLSTFQRETINKLIYTAQIASDPAYIVSEIKKNLKESEVRKIWTKLDTPITFESLKKSATSGFLKIATASYFGQKANREDIETLLNFYGGNLKFSDLLVRQATYRFKELIGKFGVKMELDFKWTLQNILKSKLVENAKLKLAQNFSFLQKSFGIFFKKISGPLSGVINKGLAQGASFLGRSAGKFLSKTGGFFSSLLAKLGLGGGNGIEKLIIVVAISISLLVMFYFLFSLVPMMVILGGFNSLSNNSPSYRDVTSGGARSMIGQYNNLTGSAFASGNACVSPQGVPAFNPTNSDWDNLKISDFDGTVNEYNCRVMCNAKKVMGALFPGPNGSLNCNANSSYKSPDGNPNYFWCTGLVNLAYKEDDPNLNQGFVTRMDSYLNEQAQAGNFIEYPLAVPNNPNGDLSEYSPICNSLEAFSPGNILITKPNTCNETYENINGYYSFKTVKPAERPGGSPQVIYNFGAHVELVLKVADEASDKKALYVISANHSRKKIKYDLIRCSGNDSNGNPTYSVARKSRFIYFRNSASGQYENLTDLYPCKTYALSKKPESCPATCQIGPNNYPDSADYGSGFSPVLNPPGSFEDTNVISILNQLNISMDEFRDPSRIYDKLYAGNFNELMERPEVLPIFSTGVYVWGGEVSSQTNTYNNKFPSKSIFPNYLLTLMSIESQGVPTAVNARSGATGLMQIMLAVANDFFTSLISPATTYTSELLSEPSRNIYIATALSGDHKTDAITAGLSGYKLIDYMATRYNAGPGRANPYFGVKVARDPNAQLVTETIEYRKKVARGAILLKIASILKDTYGYSDTQIRTALKIQ